MALTLTANNATNITHNSAQLNGSISGIGSGEEYNVWFSYYPFYYEDVDSFEDWTSGDLLPVDWDVISGSGTEGNIYKENTIVEEGTYSLKIAADAKTILSKTLIADIIPYRNKVVYLSAYLRCNVNNEARIKVKIDGNTIIEKNNGTILDNWIEIEDSVIISGSASGALTIEVYSGDSISSGMEAYFDVIYVEIYGEVLTTPVQLISVDGDFSAIVDSLLPNGQEYVVEVIEQLNISGSPEIESDNTVNFKTGFFSKFSTDLRTKVLNVYKYLTNLITNIRTLKKYSTKLYTKAINSHKFFTDLRTRVSDYDSIQPGKLDDFIVKLDGTELTDVDYSTLRITYNQNNTPSSATFVLGRYHDKLDYKLDSTFSEITDENKIEVYDGTLKIFTGYITQINANSNTETVSITAEDCRYKMSKISMELWYGGTYNLEEGDYNTVYSKNVNVAILEVISEISSLISGYDTPTFGTLFVPEYNNSYNDCASLLTDLITNSANASWYIDANERLMFSKVGQGDIKTLQLSSVGNKRHVYDTIVDNVVLNKKIDSYCTSYNVKLGKHIIKTWNRTEFSGIVAYPWELKDKPEFTDFRFQKQYTNKKLYVGSGVTIVGVYVQDKGWIIEPFIVIQYLAKYSEDDLGDITVGSGEPKKTLDLTNYGKKEINVIWMEKTKKELNEMGYFKNAEWFKGSDDSQVYLTKIQGESYDYSIFAKDLANFNLSQNIKLITQSTVTLLLNAYKYNDIKLNNRINLSNTIESNIYNNNNGFPLNIDSISIDCATRIVTLNLTNYGKNWYEKTGNYINNYNPIVIESIQKKYSAMGAFNF